MAIGSIWQRASRLCSLALCVRPLHDCELPMWPRVSLLICERVISATWNQLKVCYTCLLRRLLSNSAVPWHRKEGVRCLLGKEAELHRVRPTIVKTIAILNCVCVFSWSHIWQQLWNKRGIFFLEILLMIGFCCTVFRTCGSQSAL